MPCYHPQFLDRSKLTNAVPLGTMRPCGSCIGCRLETARQWAMRCTHEASLHEKNCFITLTYNNDHLPAGGTLVKRDLQLFFKRLRKSYGTDRIRYYACGEYGDRLSRPHYHACVFGIDFEDKEVFNRGRVSYYQNRFKTGTTNTVYVSERLRDIWRNGFVTVGELTFESAGYVARYCTKKITGKKAKDHYGEKTPEFALMSRKPGIGADWLKKFTTDVYPKDFTTMNGKRMRPPKYYDSLLEKRSPKMHAQLKKRRLENQEFIHPKRQAALEKHKELTTRSLQRSLENAKD